MRILVLGGDGYLGWPTALHLSQAGHEVAVADNFVRRHYDDELGVESLVPIEPLRTRIAVWQELTGFTIGMYIGDLTDAMFTYHVIDDFRPEAVVHYAEQAARLVLPPVQGARQLKHGVRLPDLGSAGHRPEPGRGLRPGHTGNRDGRAAGHPVRLRRGVRHGAEPVRHPGGHRAPADRVRP